MDMYSSGIAAAFDAESRRISLRIDSGASTTLATRREGTSAGSLGTPLLISHPAASSDLSVSAMISERSAAGGTETTATTSPLELS